MSIGNNIRKMRKKAGLTQKELGERLGISQAAIGQFENDSSNPKTETIIKLASALNISATELFDDPLEALDKTNVFVPNNLEHMIFMLKNGVYGYAQDEKSATLSEIKNKISLSESINASEEYYENFTLLYLKKIIQDIVDRYPEHDLIEIANLLGYYCLLNSEAKYKVSEYCEDLLGNPKYSEDNSSFNREIIMPPK